MVIIFDFVFDILSNFNFLLKYEGPEVSVTLNITTVVSWNPGVDLNGTLLDSNGLDGLLITVFPGDKENKAIFQDRVKNHFNNMFIHTCYLHSSLFALEKLSLLAKVN